jgi:hypothetical protein|tara:strand:+ start:64 stop:639 length:576 start_codon:yes stop_codon:yes gene_type:complete
MKRVVVLLIIFISSVSGLIYFSGLEKQFSYEELETDKEDLQLIKNTDFRLSIGLRTFVNKNDLNANNFGVALVFGKPKKSVKIKSVTFNFKNEFKLKSLSVTDGFYSWKEERNIKVENFRVLPDKFTIVDKSNRAYFVYFWEYIANKKDCETLDLNYNIELSVSNKEYKIEGNKKFKIKSETIFRNPIRFH